MVTRAIAIACVALAIGCDRKSSASTATSTSTSTPTAPTTWPAEIPSRAVDAKPGDHVFALHPHPAGASLDLCEIVRPSARGAVVHPIVYFGGGSELMTDMTIEHDVSGLVVIRTRRVVEAAPKPGDAVVAYVDGERSVVAAKVTRVDGASAIVSFMRRDGSRGESKVDELLPAPAGVAPLALVTRKGAAARVLVAGVDGDDVYGVDQGGAFVKARRADLTP